MNDEILDLIEKRIDGTISNSESARLNRACQHDDRVRHALDDSLFVDEMVSAIPDTEPPRQLRARIMDSLPEQPAWRHIPAANSRERMPVWRMRRSRNGWSAIVFGAGGFSLGAVLAVLAFLIATPGVDSGEMSAWNRSPVSGTFSGVDPVSTFDGELGAGGEFTIRAWRFGSLLRVHASGRAPQGAQIRLTYPPASVHFRGVEDSTPAATATADLQIASQADGFESYVRGPFDMWITLGDEGAGGTTGIRVSDENGIVLDEEFEQ